MQEEEALRGAYIQRGPRSERKTNDICYHMLRILKVILEGHPCSMLPYPRMFPFIFPLILKSWSPGDHSTKLITAQRERLTARLPITEIAQPPHRHHHRRRRHRHRRRRLRRRPRRRIRRRPRRRRRRLRRHRRLLAHVPLHLSPFLILPSHSM